MESFFDLPAHVFIIHVAVVLIPLVCAAAIALALRPDWRRRYGTLLVVVALAALVSVLLAVNSGQAFDDAINLGETIDKHKGLAETTRLLVFGLFVATLALVLVGRRQDAADARPRPALRPGLRRRRPPARRLCRRRPPAAQRPLSPRMFRSRQRMRSTGRWCTPPTAPAATATPRKGPGPSLMAYELIAAEIQAEVRIGGGGMPNFQDRLTDPLVGPCSSETPWDWVPSSTRSRP